MFISNLESVRKFQNINLLSLDVSCCYLDSRRFNAKRLGWLFNIYVYIFLAESFNFFFYIRHITVIMNSINVHIPRSIYQGYQGASFQWFLIENVKLYLYLNLELFPKFEYRMSRQVLDQFYTSKGCCELKGANRYEKVRIVVEV